MSDNPMKHHKRSSHFLDNLITVNGVIWPYFKVKRNKYRFRIINASDTRTYTLKLSNKNSVQNDNWNKVPKMYQIETDGGYLRNPLMVSEITLNIGERADVIIDFKKIKPGTKIFLLNTADDANPNTVGQIMQIIVSSKKPNCNFKIKTPKLFYNLNPLKSIRTREFLLALSFDTPESMPSGIFINNLDYMLPVVECPYLGSKKIWCWVNIEPLSHSMHIHLVQFQLLSRQTFDVKQYTIDLLAQNLNIYTGEGIPNPSSVQNYLTENPIFPKGTNEEAWKDVIRTDGVTITTIVIKFAPQKKHTQFPFEAREGYYQFHCHIVSHEDNDMMRPYKLL
jgi:spore coat protein A